MTAVTADPHIVDLPEPSTEPRIWSHSAAEKASQCALQWAHRHGPLRTPREQREPLEIGADVARLRGVIVHEAIAVALRAARDDDPATAPTRVGTPMVRYWSAAFAALGQAWEDQRMPALPGEAEQVTDMLNYALTVTPIPHPARVFTIEDERDWRTPAGRPVRYVIDYGAWQATGRLRITDWKTGRDKPEDIARNRQMLRYGLWTAESAGIDPALIDIQLVNLRTRTAKCVPLDVDRARRAVARIDYLAEQVETARAVAATPGQHCTMCDVRMSCPVAFGGPR